MALACLQQLRMLAGVHDAMLTHLQLPSNMKGLPVVYSSDLVCADCILCMCRLMQQSGCCCLESFSAMRCRRAARR